MDLREIANSEAQRALIRPPSGQSVWISSNCPSGQDDIIITDDCTFVQGFEIPHENEETYQVSENSVIFNSSLVAGTDGECLTGTPSFNTTVEPRPTVRGRFEMLSDEDFDKILSAESDLFSQIDLTREVEAEASIDSIYFRSEDEFMDLEVPTVFTHDELDAMRKFDAHKARVKKNFRRVKREELLADREEALKSRESMHPMNHLRRRRREVKEKKKVYERIVKPPLQYERVVSDAPFEPNPVPTPSPPFEFPPVQKEWHYYQSRPVNSQVTVGNNARFLLDKYGKKLPPKVYKEMGLRALIYSINLRYHAPEPKVMTYSELLYQKNVNTPLGVVCNMASLRSQYVELEKSAVSRELGLALLDIGIDAFNDWIRTRTISWRFEFFSPYLVSSQPELVNQGGRGYTVEAGEFGTSFILLITTITGCSTWSAIMSAIGQFWLVFKNNEFYSIVMDLISSIDGGTLRNQSFIDVAYMFTAPIDTLLKSEIFKIFTKILTSLSIFGMLASIGIGGDKKAWSARLDFFESLVWNPKHKNVETLISRLLEGVAVVGERLKLCFQHGDIGYLFGSKISASTWLKSCSALTSCPEVVGDMMKHSRTKLFEEKISTGVYGEITEQVTFLDAVSKLAAYNEMLPGIRLAYNEDANLRTALNKQYDLNVSFTKSYEARKINGSQRIQPLGFLFEGKPGCGKSTFMDYLHRAVAVRFELPPGDETKIYFNPENNFQVCGPTQVSLIYDDVDQDLRGTFNHASSVISTVNVTPYNIDQAAIEDKGNVWLNAIICMYSTNFEYCNLKGYIADPAAFLRRFEYKIELVPQPHFCYPNTQIIDRSRIPGNTINLWKKIVVKKINMSLHTTATPFLSMPYFIEKIFDFNAPPEDCSPEMMFNHCLNYLATLTETYRDQAKSRTSMSTDNLCKLCGIPAEFHGAEMCSRKYTPEPKPIVSVGEPEPVEILTDEEMALAQPNPSISSAQFAVLKERRKNRIVPTTGVTNEAFWDDEYRNSFYHIMGDLFSRVYYRWLWVMGSVLMIGSIVSIIWSMFHVLCSRTRMKEEFWKLLSKFAWRINTWFMMGVQECMYASLEACRIRLPKIILGVSVITGMVIGIKIYRDYYNKVTIVNENGHILPEAVQTTFKRIPVKYTPLEPNPGYNPDSFLKNVQNSMVWLSFNGGHLNGVIVGRGFILTVRHLFCSDDRLRRGTPLSGGMLTIKHDNVSINVDIKDRLIDVDDNRDLLLVFVPELKPVNFIYNKLNCSQAGPKVCPDKSYLVRFEKSYEEGEVKASNVRGGESIKNFIWNGNFNTKNGDCGGIVVGLFGSVMSIIGLHTARSNVDGRTVAEDIEGDLIKIKICTYSKVLPQLSEELVDVSKGPLTLLPYPEKSSLHAAISNPSSTLGITALGCTNEHTMRFKSGVVKMPFSEKFEALNVKYYGKTELFTKPDPKGRMVGDDWIDPFTVNLSKATNKSGDLGVWDMAVDDFLEGCDALADTDKIKPLSLYEALAGIPFTVINGTNLQTSVGPPYNTTKSNHMFVDGVTNDYMISPEFEKQLEDIDRITRVEDRMFSPCALHSLKDEPISLTKQEELKIRVFNIMSAAFNTKLKQYFGPISAFMRRHPYHFESAIGMDVTSYQWKLNYEWLDVNPYWGAADNSDFDVRESTIEWLSVVKFIMGLAKICNYSSEDQRVLSNLLHSCSYVTRNIKGDLFQTTHMMPTGFWLTIFANGIRNSLQRRYAYFRLRPSNCTDPFRVSVRQLVLGDDNVMTTNKEWFNQQAIQFVVKEFGAVLTSANKLPNIEKFDTKESVTFLKRSFVVKGEFCYAPIEIKTLLRLGQYKVNSKSISAKTQNEIIYQNILSEAFLHGEEFFAEVSAIIYEICDFKGYDVPKQPFAEYEALHRENKLSVWTPNFV